MYRAADLKTYEVHDKIRESALVPAEYQTKYPQRLPRNHLLHPERINMFVSKRLFS